MHYTLLFNMCAAHCYLPLNLMQTTLVPLLQNKSGDISDPNNYRAIALSNCISKLLETVLLYSFQSRDTMEDEYQFGFKPGHSTSVGCSVLKKVVDYYRTHGSYVLFVSLI